MPCPSPFGGSRRQLSSSSSRASSSGVSSSASPPSSRRRTKTPLNPFPKALSPAYRRVIDFTVWRAGLDSITLEAVLQGETCPPIALPDFYHFLRYSDFSVENLLFVWWYEGYRSRWEREFGNDEKGKLGNPAKLPVPHLESMPVPPPTAKMKGSLSIKTDPFPSTSTPSTPKGPATPVSPLPLYTETVQTRADGELDLNAFYNYAYDAASHPQVQREPHPVDGESFQSEVNRVLATFLLASSPYELLIEADERDRCIKEAQFSTDWRIFTPIYNTTMTHLRLVSLPRFLLANAQNIAARTRRFWAITGAILLSAGIALAVMFVRGTCGLPGNIKAEHQAPSPFPTANNGTAGASDDIVFFPDDIPGRASPRQYRLISLIPIWFGVAMIFPAYRGFCGVSFLFGRVQRRGWDDVRSEESSDPGSEIWETIYDSRLGEKVYSQNTEGVGRIAPFLTQNSRDLEASAAGSSSGSPVHSRGISSSSSATALSPINSPTSALPFQTSPFSVLPPTDPASPSRRKRKALIAFWRKIRPAPFGPARVIHGSHMDRTMYRVYMRQWKELWVVPTVAALFAASIIMSVRSREYRR